MPEPRLHLYAPGTPRRCKCHDEPMFEFKDDRAPNGRAYTCSVKKKEREVGYRRAKGMSPNWSAVHRTRISEAIQGEKHPLWKDDPGYSAIHDWVRRHKDYTGVCEMCGVEDEPTEWANVSGEYRRDLDDYHELCRPCHRRFDKESHAR